MQALAIKYRPKTFDDVVEQGAVKQILQDQLATKTHKNCYLFTGGAGTGKTTCARIFAADINGGQGSPIEIDAASNNGVENVRDIITNAKFKSLDSEFKVYIIDECHMLSTGAWNAMLKILEEPPAQTVFILCTTDPQKIPATILSRVQRYDFRRITHKAVVDRLAYIMQSERFELLDGDTATVDTLEYDFEPEALDYIAKLADGGMRDAITLLDKCISYRNEITVQTVVEALGTTDYETMFNLFTSLYSQDVGAAVSYIEEAYRAGVDLKQFMKQFSYFVLDLYKYYLLNGFDYLQLPSTYESKLKGQPEGFFYFALVLLEELNKLNSEIKWETAPKALIEATLILICKED